VADPSIVRFRKVVAAAYAELEARRQEVNDLNVFPVADGDTGDNMIQTLQAVMVELDRLNGQMVDEIGREVVVHAVARAALLGARGNSGVILSQIVRGAAEELSSRPGELIDPVLVSAALARAADAAYDSVRNPAEGTMITVVREMAHRVASELAHMKKQRLNTDATDDEQDELLAEVLERALEAAEASVERSPELLPVLREHGVVDAGGYGVTLLIAGLIAGLRGEGAVLHEVPHPPPPLHAAKRHGQHESAHFRYCTNFVVIGEELDRTAFVSQLEEFGDSVIVVGDQGALRVHVHTNHPERARDLFKGVGEVHWEEPADMFEQEVLRAARLADGAGATVPALCGVVAVAAGSGIKKLYDREGALVVEGGQTLNPSTDEILAAITQVEADQVIVLPNSGNVIMAAERAAELSEKDVKVVETRSLQAGLACLVRYEPALQLEENTVRFSEALEDVRTGWVAPAARDDKKGRYRAGDAVGSVSLPGEVEAWGDTESNLMAWGDAGSTLGAVLAQLAEGRELLSCYAGEAAPLDADAVHALAPEGVELEWHEGGQPHYWWLIAAE
jgi:DAK2 domain fusion protein YloV